MSETGAGTGRRRRRATAGQGPPPPRPDGVPVQPEPTVAKTAPAAPTAATAPAEAAKTGPNKSETGAKSGGEKRPAKGRASRRPRDSSDGPERGLRDLVGSGPSQLGLSGALRGRDVNRPSADDLAEAERDVEIVRRHWRPAADANRHTLG